MQLYLSESLVKAVPPAGGAAAPSPPVAGGVGPGTPAAPDLGAAAPDTTHQPCSLGGGAKCLAGGGDGGPNPKHKVGGSIEQKHAEWQARQGAGAPQVETAAPESQLSPEQASDAAAKHAESNVALDPKGVKGTISTESSDYPANSNPLDHYRVAAVHEALGGGNDSSKQVAEGHRKIARERAEALDGAGHMELADQLREHGLHDAADHHKQTGEKETAREAEVQAARDAAVNLGAQKEREANIKEVDQIVRDRDAASADKDAAREAAAEIGPAKDRANFKENAARQGSERDVNAARDAAVKLGEEKGASSERAAQVADAGNYVRSQGEKRSAREEAASLGDRMDAKTQAKEAKESTEASAKTAEQDATVAAAEQLGQDVESRADAKTAQQDATVAAAEQVGKDVEARAAAKTTQQDASVAAVEKVGTDVEADKERKKQLKDDDPHAHALEEWEAGKAKAEQDHAKKTEDFKARVDDKHNRATVKHEKQTKADEAKHTKALDAHKSKVDSTHKKAQSEWDAKDKARKDFDTRLDAHQQNTPEAPPAGATDAAKANHKTQKAAHKAEGTALRRQRPPVPGKKPTHPGHTKGAPKPPNKAAAPKHPGYKTGAPKPPEHPDRPKEEDFETKKPSSASEKAQHTEYKQKATSARDNIKSHLDGNPDLSDEDRQKLEAAHEALGSHADSERMPTKEQAADARKMGQVAGKHGKAAYEEPKADTKEELRPPETDLERVQHADHKAKAQQMQDNIQSHIDAIQADDSISPEQQAAQVEKLQQIHKTLDAHTQLEHVPTGEHQSELKALTTAAGEHGKTAYEDPAGESGEEGSAKTTSSRGSSGSKGRSKDWATTFGRGASIGSKAAKAAQHGTGEGALAEQALGGVGDLAASAAENLLHKPAVAAMEARRKQSNQDAKDAVTSEDTVKGLYLSLDADLDLIKAVSSPNAGSVTDSDKRAQRKIKESYAKHPIGVMGGSGVAMHDDPDVGAKWQHDEDDSVDADLEENVRNKDKKTDGDPSNDDEADEDDTSKAVDILKALRSTAEEVVGRARYNPSEVVFMKEVLGYTDQDIHKGLAKIIGRNRHRFHEWMLDRMSKSVDTMMGSIYLG